MTEPATPPVPPPLGGTVPWPIPTQGFQMPAGYGPPPVHRYRPVPPPVAADGTPLAEPGERLVAVIIDSALTLAVLLIPFAAVLYWVIRRAIDTFNANLPAPDSDIQIQPGTLIRPFLETYGIALAILVPLSLLVGYLYHVTYMTRSGQTVGKKVMKIKTVRQVDGGRISLAQARKRWLVTGVAVAVAPYFQYADVLWLLWDTPYRQCLHDKCAETVVVKVRGE